jgi:YVTN family beta-propeller protein
MKNRFRIWSSMVIGLALAFSVATPAHAAPVVIEDIVAGSRGLAMAPDGSKLYSGDPTTQLVSVIDTATSTVEKTIQMPQPASNIPYIKQIVVAPDGDTIYVLGMVGISSQNSFVWVVDVTAESPAIVATITVGAQPQDLAITPDGSTLYVPNGANASTISVIDTSTNTVTETLGPFDSGVSGEIFKNPYAIEVSPDGSTFYVAFYKVSAGVGGGMPGLVSFSTSTNAIIAQKAFGTGPADSVGHPTDLAISSDGQYLFAVNLDNSPTTAWVRKYDVTTSPATAFDAPVVEITGAGKMNTPHKVGVSPDGSWVYVSMMLPGGAGSQYFRIFDATTTSVIAEFTLGYPGDIAVPVSSTALYAYVGTTAGVTVIGIALMPPLQTVNVEPGATIATEPLEPFGFESPVTYDIEPDLPAGFDFDESTGQVSGSSADPIAKTVYTITGTDGTYTASSTFTLTVEIAPAPATLPATGASTDELTFGFVLICAGVVAIVIRRRLAQP